MPILSRRTVLMGAAAVMLPLGVRAAPPSG